MTVQNVPWSEHYRAIGVRIPDESGLGDKTHAEIHIVAKRFRERARKIAALDPGLKDDIRVKRSAAMLKEARAELSEGVTAATQYLRKTLADLELRQVMAGQPKGPDDSKAERDLWQNAVFDMRGQLERLPRKERGKAILAASAAGNPLALAALDSSLVDLVVPELVAAARSNFARVADQQVGDLVEAAEAAVDEASAIEHQIGAMARHLALDAGVPEQALGVVARPAPLKMTAAEKAEVIASEGLEFFKELVAVGAPSGDDDPPKTAA